MENTVPVRTPLLLGIQYLRFFAAFLVILNHCWQIVPVVGTGNLGASFEGGAIGVDVFFVISGFVMVYITNNTQKSPSSFIIDRLLRVTPPYWIATLGMIFLLLVWPSAFRGATLSLPVLLTSFFYIPWPSMVTEGAAPLLTVGWTLNYEILFYAIFFLAMIVSNKYRILISSSAICMLAGMQIFIDNNVDDIFQFYSSTIMLEFLFGMLLGFFLCRIHVSLPWVLLILSLSVGALVWALSQPVERLDQDRFIVWGGPSMLLVAAVLLADFARLTPRSATLLLLGNASYSIYLTHLFVIGGFRKMWPFVSDVVAGNDLVLIGSAATLSVVGGVAFHVAVEKPLVSWAKKVRGRRLDALRS